MLINVEILNSQFFSIFFIRKIKLPENESFRLEQKHLQATYLFISEHLD